MLLQDWATDAPTPPYSQDPPSFSPHPFMGLGKFVAGRIHQMGAAKSYMAPHPSWFDENPDLTCPRCGIELASFQHTIFTGPARTRVLGLLLKELCSLGHDAIVRTEPHLIRALGQYITDTITGFPPDMSPDYSPTLSLSPPT